MGRAFLILGVVRPAIVATHIRRSRHSSRVARTRTACRQLFHHRTTGGTHPSTPRCRLLPFLRPAFPQEARWTPHSRTQVAGLGSLIPANKTYIQQRYVYDGQCKAAGLSNMHGLRHRYAQMRYEALTGWKAPATGGSPTAALTHKQLAQDNAARQRISRELGHERIQITAVYLGR